MNEKFFDLKKEKQDRMINAALKVFGMRGYQFASTDDIVREAGCSSTISVPNWGFTVLFMTIVCVLCLWN